MTAAIALVLFAQGATSVSLPAGASTSFAKVALDVEARLVSGDVAGAREAAKTLPVRTPVIAWSDEALLPAALKAQQAAAFSRAVASWARGVKGFAPGSAGEPTISIGFSKLLAEGPDGLPLATSLEFGKPVRATIGLSIGKPSEPITAMNLSTEIAYVLGRYMGVDENPFPGTAMHRDPRPGIMSFFPQRDDANIAEKNLQLADQLRAGIEAGKPIGLSAASIQLTKPTIDLGEVSQGEVIRSAIEFENKGLGPLAYHIVPDCNCFRVIEGKPVLPGEKGSASFLVETDRYIGRQDKVLLLLSNDPLRPSIQVPVTFRARPAYRLFRPEGPNLVVSPGDGGFDVFLIPEEGSTLRPLSSKLEDIEGKLTSAPWTGTLADPEMQETAKPRKGWRFHVQLPSGLPSGQTTGRILIDTSSVRFGKLQYTFTAQKGIVALPETSYVGDLVAGSRASFLISRPNRPFKITSIEGGPFKATWHEQRQGSEYRIDLVYPGGEKKGEVLIPIRIHTDDPKEPLVEAVINGTIK